MVDSRTVKWGFFTGMGVGKCGVDFVGWDGGEGRALGFVDTSPVDKKQGSDR